MTPEQIDQERREFEAAFNLDFTRFPGSGKYAFRDMEWSWIVWLARAERALSREAEPVGETPAEQLASRLIDAWCADKGKQIPWAKAIQIIAIVTKQSDDERDRLLRMGDEDGSCEMCGRKDAAPPSAPEGVCVPRELPKDIAIAHCNSVCQDDYEQVQSDWIALLGLLAAAKEGK